MKVRVCKGSVQAFHLNSLAAPYQLSAVTNGPSHRIRGRGLPPTLELRQVGFPLHGKARQGPSEVNVRIHHTVNLRISTHNDWDPVIEHRSSRANPCID